MQVIRNIKLMQAVTQGLRQKGNSIGFVPTMGALHAGHLSLIRRSVKENNFTVVSIFVNPLQFGPREDFKCYPRPIKQDLSLCKKEGVDFVFWPRSKDMYTTDFKTSVFVEELSNVFCGASRPGHFRGVTTVVNKLFNIVQPSVAYFGQKDAQQATIIKRMVKDLNIPLKIRVMPIVRSPDGLALSSRNIYLNESERKEALVLSQALGLAKELLNNGIKDSQRIISRMRRLIREKKSARIDYISIVDSNTLRPIKKIDRDCLVALAVWIGKTRLIDNTVICV